MSTEIERQSSALYRYRTPRTQKYRNSNISCSMSDYCGISYTVSVHKLEMLTDGSATPTRCRPCRATHQVTTGIRSSKPQSYVTSTELSGGIAFSVPSSFTGSVCGLRGGVMARYIALDPRVRRLIRATRPGSVVGSNRAFSPAKSS